MKVLITTIGTSGDINPFVAVGIALQARGHDVSLLINPYFKKQALDAGLCYLPLGEPIDLRQMADMVDLMHPLKAFSHALHNLILPNASVIIEALNTIFLDDPPDIVLSHHTCNSARWVCEQHNILHAGGVLAPIMWMSRKDPSLFQVWEPENPPELYLRARNFLVRRITRWVTDRPFNAIRARYGYPRRRDIMFSDAEGGAVTLALWSRHFRGSISDDPGNAHICGFPWFDRHKEFEHPDVEVQDFLDEGKPPIVFTLGTAAVHTSGDFYNCAAQACRILGRRGLLLTRHREYAPKTLPDGVKAFTYAPFSTLFPQACLTVHHGGIGTTAQAMRAGRPMVIVPFAHDQFDNAARAKRLGVSITLKRKNISPESMVNALRAAIDNPDVVKRASELGKILSKEDGALTAAIELENAVKRTA